jgi:hypothetical protein
MAHLPFLSFWAVRPNLKNPARGGFLSFAYESGGVGSHA